MRASKFVSGSDPVAALERELEANRAEDEMGVTSEAGETVESPSGRALGESLRDDGTIRFPHFDPVPEDLDDAAPTVSFPTLTSFQSDKPRTRPRSRKLLLLVVLVALLAGPSYLWLRQHLDVFASRIETVQDRLAPTASTQKDVAPAVPSESITDQTVPPRPVGTGSVGSAPAKPAPPTGRMSVSAPAPMQVYLKGRVIGTTGAGAIALPVGNHDLEFVNDAVGYRQSQNVTIRSGRTTRVKIDLPTGLLNVNATPWAEVWMDNKLIGQTPIGDFPARIGRHELRFRHPELGERRAIVVVTLNEPISIAMDLREK